MVLRYAAGKGRLAAKIAKAIQIMLQKEEVVPTHYAEPFSGMFRVGLALLETTMRNQLCQLSMNDVNPDVYVFWKEMANTTWLPNTETLTTCQWIRWKKKQTPSAQRTFYGLSLSYHGTIFDLVKPHPHYNTPKRMATLLRRVRRAKEMLRAVSVAVTNQPADTLDFKNTLIYSDPPYYNAKNNGWSKEKESHFWDVTVPRWLSTGSGNIVLVSTMHKVHPRFVRLEMIWSAQNIARTHNEYLWRVHLIVDA
jgi:site-specific DNA-adenine methylase